MSWEWIDQELNSDKTLTHYSLGGLPSQSGSISHSPSVSLYSMSVARNALIANAPSEVFQQALLDLSLYPDRVESATSLSRGYTRLAVFNPSDDMHALCRSLGLKNAFFAFDSGSFETTLARDFLFN